MALRPQWGWLWGQPFRKFGAVDHGSTTILRPQWQWSCNSNGSSYMSMFNLHQTHLVLHFALVQRIDIHGRATTRLHTISRGPFGNCKGSTRLSNQHRRLPSSSRTFQPCQVAGEERLLYCHFDICEEKDFFHNADIGPIWDLVWSDPDLAFWSDTFLAFWSDPLTLSHPVTGKRWADQWDISPQYTTFTSTMSPKNYEK